MQIDILGYRVRDKITGFEGIATSLAFDLYGCINVLINPGLDKDGKPRDQNWYDKIRLDIIDPIRVMMPPFAVSTSSPGQDDGGVPVHPVSIAGPENKPGTPSVPSTRSV